jgi:glycosyltransferase involved in cell wall biosynthesis
MKVVFIALSVRGVLGQYIDAFITAISTELDIHLFVPNHYSGDIGHSTLHSFNTGHTRKEAFKRLINPVLGLKFWQQVFETKPDVIHLFSGSPYPWILLGVHVAKLKGIPMILTVHDPLPHPGNFFNVVMSYAEKITISAMAMLHIHVECFAKILIQQGISEEKICVIPHGCLASQFLKYKEENIQREEAVLFFGRLELYKGLDLLVEAGLKLKGKMRVIIAGPGKVSKSLLKIIYSYPDIFEFHNRYLSEAEVAVLFQRAAVCVLPYKQATQSSLPLISAAFGVPVVATAVGGFVEDIAKVNGLLVKPDSPDAIAAGILKMVGQTPHYPQEYKFQVLSEKFIDLYEQTAC